MSKGAIVAPEPLVLAVRRLSGRRLALENKLVTYRVYGPALQITGEITSGIDIWPKRNPIPSSTLYSDLEVIRTGTRLSLTTRIIGKIYAPTR